MPPSWYVYLLLMGYLSSSRILQLHFNLQTGERWDPTYGGFDYVGLYNYVVEFFEDLHDPLTKKRARELLLWWDE